MFIFLFKKNVVLCEASDFFFLHVASFINLVHALIIVHFLCGMHHNMDSQIEHKPAGMIRAHVQLNIDKKTQVKQMKAVNLIPLTNEMLLPLSICMN